MACPDLAVSCDIGPHPYLETSGVLGVALSRMSEDPEPSPKEKESAERRLQETIAKMSIVELCELMIEIQTKILEADLRTVVNKSGPGTTGTTS
jgi:hypothetical protein